MRHFDLDEQLAELDSEEAANFGLPVRPMTRLEIAVLLLGFVPLT